MIPGVHIYRIISVWYFEGVNLFAILVMRQLFCFIVWHFYCLDLRHFSHITSKVLPLSHHFTQEKDILFYTVGSETRSCIFSFGGVQFCRIITIKGFISQKKYIENIFLLLSIMRLVLKYSSLIFIFSVMLVLHNYTYKYVDLLDKIYRFIIIWTDVIICKYIPISLLKYSLSKRCDKLIRHIINIILWRNLCGVFGSRDIYSKYTTSVFNDMFYYTSNIFRELIVLGVFIYLYFGDTRESVFDGPNGIWSTNRTEKMFDN